MPSRCLKWRYPVCAQCRAYCTTPNRPAEYLYFLTGVPTGAYQVPKVTPLIFILRFKWSEVFESCCVWWLNINAHALKIPSLYCSHRPREALTRYADKLSWGLDELSWKLVGGRCVWLNFCMKNETVPPVFTDACWRSTEQMRSKKTRWGNRSLDLRERAETEISLAKRPMDAHTQPQPFRTKQSQMNGSFSPTWAFLEPNYTNFAREW